MKSTKQLFSFLSTYRLLTYVILVIAFLFFFLSCDNMESEKKEMSATTEIKESLLDANKKAVKTEEQQINDFLSRYKWNVTQTGSGLKYLIYENGNGEKAVEGNVVTFEYTVSLLNGIKVYTSQQDGPKEFLVGKGGVESGLEEGILLLREGDRAKLILPSHLAYGLAGDQDRIPPKTTIIYDIHLLKVR